MNRLLIMNHNSKFLQYSLNILRATEVTWTDDLLEKFQNAIFLGYRTRAINRRGFYSEIIILGFKLSHKNHIKNTF